MAQSFFGGQFRMTLANTRQVVYTSPAFTQTVLHSIYISNTGGVDITASVEIGTSFFIVKDAPIPVGSSLVFDKPITIDATQTIQVSVSINTADVIISALQITP